MTQKTEMPKDEIRILGENELALVTGGGIDTKALAGSLAAVAQFILFPGTIGHAALVYTVI
jgi:hypothetical protein